MSSSIAGIPSGVPGTLMNRFGVAALSWRALASSTVLFVSCASLGDTSSETQPSTAPLESQIGRNSLAALVRSKSASSKNSSSPSAPAASRDRICSS
jgi:hypothetical protein